MSFKTELHCHTSEFSRCANMNGADTAELYIRHGYSTVVVTNHFRANYTSLPTHADVVRNYFEAAEIMRDAAAGRLNVLTGMELTFKESGNDYLVYGMDEDTLRDLPEIFDMGLRGFFGWAEENGVIIVQAHPLRFGIATKEPWYLHGIEAYNGNHDDFCNMTAQAWADIYDRGFNEDGRRFIRTSGSDHHWHDQPVGGGIVTDLEIKTNEDLMSVLRSGKYELLGV